MAASGFSYHVGMCIFLKWLKDTVFVEITWHNSGLISKLWLKISLSGCSKIQRKPFYVHIYFLYMHINLKGIWGHWEIETSEIFLLLLLLFSSIRFIRFGSEKTMKILFPDLFSPGMFWRLMCLFQGTKVHLVH